MYGKQNIIGPKLHYYHDCIEYGNFVVVLGSVTLFEKNASLYLSIRY